MPAKGICRDTGLTYLVTASGDHTEETEHRPQVEMVCVARKHCPTPGLSQEDTGGPGNAPAAGNGQPQSLSRVWNRGQGQSQDTWCAWGSRPVLPGRAMS